MLDRKVKGPWQGQQVYTPKVERASGKCQTHLSCKNIGTRVHEHPPKTFASTDSTYILIFSRSKLHADMLQTLGGGVEIQPSCLLRFAAAFGLASITAGQKAELQNGRPKPGAPRQRRSPSSSDLGFGSNIAWIFACRSITAFLRDAAS